MKLFFGKIFSFLFSFCIKKETAKIVNIGVIDLKNKDSLFSKLLYNSGFNTCQIDDFQVSKKTSNCIYNINFIKIKNIENVQDLFKKIEKLSSVYDSILTKDDWIFKTSFKNKIIRDFKYIFSFKKKPLKKSKILSHKLFILDEGSLNINSIASKVIKFHEKSMSLFFDYLIKKTKMMLNLDHIYDFFIKEINLVSDNLRKKSKLLHDVLSFSKSTLLVIACIRFLFLSSSTSSNLIESFFEKIILFLSLHLPKCYFSRMIYAGIMPAIATCTSFVPLVCAIFFIIGLTEKSSAFKKCTHILENLMSKIGLQPQSIMPLLAGFVCSVPGYVGARSIKSKSARIATLFAISYIPCTAKTAVFVAVAIAVFGKNYIGVSIFGVYALSVMLSIISSLCVKYIMKIAGNSVNNYEIENEDQNLYINVKFKTNDSIVFVVRQAIIRSLHFFKDAMLKTAVASFILWSLLNIPGNLKDQQYKHYLSQLYKTDISASEYNKANYYVQTNSVAALIGKSMEFAIKPLGFDWRLGLSIIAAFSAKEAAIGMLALLYSEDDYGKDFRENLSNGIRKHISIPSAIAYIVITLTCAPCISALIVFSKEIGSVLVGLTLFIFTTVISWFLGFGSKKIAELVLDVF